MVKGKKLLAMLLILTLVVAQSGIVVAASSVEMPDIEFEEGVEDWNECLFYGHKEQVVKGTAATCTKTGLTDGLRCSTCGETLTAQEVIPMKEHKTVTMRGQEASCTDNGYTESSYCLVCKTVFAEKEVIPATGHKPTVEQGHAPTCEEAGYTDKVYCSVCGEVETESQPIAATGHKPVYTDSKLPTCTEDGLEKGSYCEICKEVLEAEVTIPAIGHTLIQDAAVAPTCTETGLTAGEHCTKCDYKVAQQTVNPLGHKSETTITKATTTENGKINTVCTVCDATLSTKTIAKVSTVKLSYTEKVYTGKKLAAPTLTVKDSADKKLVEGTDYTVSGLIAKTSVGRYKVIVTFEGNYSGTKTLYYTIVPKKVSSVKIRLNSASKYSGYDDVKVSWSKSTGAKGYLVYYKKSSAKKYTYLTATTKTYVLKKNLTDGVKYTFKVIPYYKTSTGKTKYYSTTQYKTASAYTLKAVPGVKLSKKGTKVKVKWTNIPGETGYQISKSTKKTGVGKITTYQTTKGTYKYISATKGKTYYYKVRAYKVVDGKKIYGPWSKAKGYKRK